MSIKFIHTGDIHFGVENYSKIDPITGLHSRFRDFILCFEKVINYGIKHRVDFLLICGDIYHTANPSPTQQREFARIIMKFIQEKIPVVIILGNHDNPVASGNASSMDIFSELNIPCIHIISKPQILTLEFSDNRKIQILGFPWPTRSRLIDKEDYKNLSTQELDDKLQYICTFCINELIEKLNPHIPSIFAGHLAIAEAKYSGSERTTLLGKDPIILTSTLAREDFSYVALGHIHRYQNLNYNSLPPIVYSGSIERVDFSEENEEKGFCLVELDSNDLNYRFVKTPSRDLITIEIDVREKVDPTLEIINEIKKYKIENSIVRLIYIISSTWEEPLRLNEVNDIMSSAHFYKVIRKTEQAEIIKRSIISEDLSLMDALDKYIEQEKLENYSENIKSYTLLLQRELNL